MKRALQFALATLLALPLIACASRMQSAVDSAGPMAARIESLFWIFFWVTSTVFVLTMAVLVFAVWRHKPVDQELRNLTSDEERTRTRWVASASLVTVVVLFVLLVLSVRTGKAVNKIETKNPLTIEVIGHQWWWEVRYPNSQADMIVITANEIHIPVGVPVVINAQSTDVIHSFWLPNLQGKRDLMPGYKSTLWFQADKEGRWRGQCAEYCGLQHAHMAFEVVAESPEKFNQWLLAQREPAAEPTDALAQRGRQVFEQGTCVMCHTIRGTIAGSQVGPDLTHVASRNRIAAGTLPFTRGHLAGWIADAQSIKPGVRMPSQTLPPEDLQALLAYMETLK